ncbi:MAG TPA: polyprenyl synthetase family protein, partial [Clostridiales bacterium]|nr:polyprenyl synthetase family protein [Clostridiales bacterium]
MKKYRTEDFNEVLEKKSNYIEEIIREYLPEEEGIQKIIFEAMNYSVLAGGKRLRPMLMMETYILFGGKDLECIKPFMAAIEFIHSYSLVHDDLPAMDNDEYRRGKKTTHIKYGEAIGILTGDGLLNYAFETAVKSYYNIEYKDRFISALEVLASKAGTKGMIGGQVIDTFVLEGMSIDGQDKKQLLQAINHMYDLKTSGLIKASMMIGAILAGASKKYVLLIEEMSSNIGIAFQIQDDILDVTSTAETLGKPIKSDQRNEKLTYVSILGLEKAKEEVASFSKNSLEIYKKINKSNL